MTYQIISFCAGQIGGFLIPHLIEIRLGIQVWGKEQDQEEGYDKKTAVSGCDAK